MRQFAVIFIVMAFLLVTCSDKDKAGKDLYDNGVAALDRGDAETALEIFDSIGSNYPEFPYALFGKAEYYYREGLIYEAINANYRVLREHPKFLPALLLNARLFLKVGRPELTYFYIALYEDNGGDRVVGAIMEAEALMYAGKLDEADQILEKYLSDFPDNPLLLLTKARNGARLGEFEQSFETCATALSLSNNDAAVFRAAGDFFRLTGLYDSAAQYYDAALEAGKDRHYFVADIVESFLSLNYLHRAKLLLAMLDPKSQNSHRYYSLRSDYYARKGKHLNAMHEYGIIVPRFSLVPTVMSNFAIAKSKGLDRLGAEQYFEGALMKAVSDSFPNSAVIALKQAYVDMLFDIRRPEIAGPVIESMLDSATTDFKTLHDAALAYLIFEKKDKMRDALNRAAESSRGNPSQVAALGRLYITMDSVMKADRLFREVLEIDKTNKTAILGEVKIAREKFRYTEALKFLNSFDEYVSYDPDIAAEKLSLYQESGELNSAMQFAKRLIGIAKRDLQRYRTAADVARKMGDKKKAAEIYQNCLDNNPDDPDARIMLARHYFNAGEYPEAENLINEALSLDSLHIEGLTLLADMNRAGGRVDSAMALYSRVIEIDQYATDALGSLAVVMLERGEHLNRAENYAMRAIKYDGANVHHRNTLGRIYYEMGKYKIARTSFKKALQVTPEDPEGNYYAGMNYIKLGQPDSARIFLQRAVDIGLEGRLKSEAQKALKNL
jgi:tetratricopeptide (TPR) repeat protein